MDDRRLREALGYRRFAGPRPAVLLFETGYHVEADFRDCAMELGWRVASLSVAAKGSAEGRFVGTLLEALCVHRPDFIVTINHFGFDEDGVLAGLLARYDVAVASWFVDHPLTILPVPARQATPNTQLFSLERASLQPLRAAGFDAPAHLPTASSARRHHPARIDRERAKALGAPLQLVAHSWHDKARVEPSATLRRAAAALGWPMPLPRAFAGAPLAEHLAAGTGSPHERMWAARVALAESSLRSRIAFAAALQREGLVVRGDEGWRHHLPSLDLRAPVDTAAGLPAAFAGTTINLNITSDQLATAATQRVWDVPGAGAFLLTDAQEDVLEAFREGEEVVVYRNFEEARALARHYLDRPAERVAVVQRARRVVEGGHRYAHRLARIAEVMAAREGRRAAPAA